MAEQNPTLSVRIADFLVEVAHKIREMSVDRVAYGITWAAVAVILVVGAIAALIWLLIGIFRILGALMGIETAYAVVGIVLIIAGAVLWYQRYPQDRKSEE